MKKRSSKTVRILLILLVVILLAMAVLLLLRRRASSPRETAVPKASPVAAAADGVYDFTGGEPTEETLFGLTGVKKLDLTGCDISAEIYEKLCRTYPDAEIRWSVPVGSGRVPCDAERVTLDPVTEESLDLLGYLPGLKEVDAGGSTEYGLLAGYAQAHPEISVRYTVPYAGETLDASQSWLTLNHLTEVDTEALIEALGRMPRVTDVDLVGVPMTNEQKAALHSALPDIRFYWFVELGGSRFRSTEDHLNFSDLDFDSFDELLTGVGCFNAPVYVDVGRQGFESVQMERAVAKYPDTQFAWMISIGGMDIRTDVKVLDLGYQKGDRALRDGTIDALKYCTWLEALSLDNQAISDLTPLSGLKKLKILCLGQNRITDIKPLAGLTELEYLNLYANDIVDLSPLAGMTGLTDLNLIGTKVQKLDVLENMPGLKRVCASKNERLSDEEKARIQAAMPETKFDFTSSNAKTAWQNSPVYDIVDQIFIGRWMQPLYPGTAEEANTNG